MSNKLQSDYYRVRADNVKEQVPIYDILDYYGIEVRTTEREVQYPCPLHGDGQDAAFSARAYPPREDKPQWDTYCWGCQKSRDVIGWVQDKEGVQFLDAIKIIEKTFDVKNIPDFNDYIDPKNIIGKRENEKKSELTKQMQKGFESKTKKFGVFDFLEKKMDNLVKHYRNRLPMKSVVRFYYALDRLRFDYKKENVDPNKAMQMASQLTTKIKELEIKYSTTESDK